MRTTVSMMAEQLEMVRVLTERAAKQLRDGGVVRGQADRDIQSAKAILDAVAKIAKEFAS